MAVPKKRTSMSKKRIRRNIWRKKAYLTAVKNCSLVKPGNSKSFIEKKPNKRTFGFYRRVLSEDQIKKRETYMRILALLNLGIEISYLKKTK